MDGFQSLLSWQFILFTLGIAMITYIMRIIFEFVDEKVTYDISKSTIYKELYLPLSPIMYGILVAVLLKQYPYPDGISSLGGRILFGLVAGGLSGLVYKMVKGLIDSKIQAAEDHNSQPNNTQGNDQPDNTASHMGAGEVPKNP